MDILFDFVKKVITPIVRLAISLAVSAALVYILIEVAGMSIENKASDPTAYMMTGCALAGVVYALNSILFDVLEVLGNKFFQWVKCILFFAIWGVVVYLQFTEGSELVASASYSGEVEWLLDGLLYSIFVTPVVGVLFSMVESVDTYMEGATTIVWKPILITIIATAVSVVVGLLVSLLPFVRPYLYIALPILSNGIGILLLIKGRQLPYMQKDLTPEEIASIASGAYGGGYSGGYGSGRRDDRTSGGDISREMYGICRSYGGLQTLPGGHINTTITYSISGSSVDFTINASVTVDSSERDSYRIREFKDDAGRLINSMKSDIISEAQDRIRSLQYNYTGYDKNYSIHVYVNLN